MTTFEHPSAWLGLTALVLLTVAPRPEPAARRAVRRALAAPSEWPTASPLTWEVAVGGRVARGVGEVQIEPSGVFDLLLREPLGLTVVARARSDGAAVAVTVPGARRHWIAADAGAVLDAVASPSMAAWSGLMLGRLPMEPTALREVRPLADGWWTRWEHGGQRVVVELGEAGALRRARVSDAAGLPLLTAAWARDGLTLEDWEAGATLRLGGLDWRRASRVPADLSAPAGFASGRAEDLWLDGLPRELLHALRASGLDQRPMRRSPAGRTPAN